jgi:hypothetical protein
LIPGIAAAQDQGPAVQRAAEAGLKPFLDLIPPGQEKEYGFENRADFAWAQLGRPYELRTVQPQDLLNPNALLPGVPIVSLNQWRFPVMSRGRICALLTVARMRNDWEAVDLGAAGLASELDAMEKRYGFDNPSLSKTLLRLYQWKIDFVGISGMTQNLEDDRFFPLRSAQLFLGLKGGEFVQYSGRELGRLMKKSPMSGRD